MGGGSGGGGSGHGVDVFEKKKSDEEEVFFVLECRIFGQIRVGQSLFVLYITLAERFLGARASRP